MLREVRTFLMICRYGTFTAAAGRLGMTQSAVSDHVRRLEAYVGAPLFDRMGHSARLNATGKRLLPMAKEAWDSLQRMRLPAAGEVPAQLRVGTIASTHNTLALRAMVAFGELHPAAAVRLIRYEDGMRDAIKRGEVDVGILLCSTTPLPAGLEREPLLRVPFVLIAQAGTAAANWREALRAAPLLRYDESSPSGELVEDFLFRAKITAGKSIWVNHFDTMASMAAQGLGVALVPRVEFGDIESRLRVFALGEGTFHRVVCVMRASGVANPLADAFVAVLRQEARREPHAEPP